MELRNTKALAESRSFRVRQVPLLRPLAKLAIASDGRVASHRDYWDTGEELFARLPLVGALMGWLRRRLAAPQGR